MASYAVTVSDEEREALDWVCKLAEQVLAGRKPEVTLADITQQTTRARRVVARLFHPPLRRVR